jgi:hypothetical protein
MKHYHVQLYSHENFWTESSLGKTASVATEFFFYLPWEMRLKRWAYCMISKISWFNPQGLLPQGICKGLGVLHKAACTKSEEMHSLGCDRNPTTNVCQCFPYIQMLDWHYVGNKGDPGWRLWRTEKPSEFLSHKVKLCIHLPNSITILW